MKTPEKDKNEGTPETDPQRSPGAKENRYPEDSLIDAMLESDDGDDIPPSLEEVFSRPPYCREEERSEPPR